MGLSSLKILARKHYHILHVIPQSQQFLWSGLRVALMVLGCGQLFPQHPASLSYFLPPTSPILGVTIVCLSVRMRRRFHLAFHSESIELKD